MLAKVESVPTRVFVKANPYKRPEIQISGQEYLFKEYYTSLNYRSRLSVLEKLLHGNEEIHFSDKFILDVLTDNCPNVRQYLLQNFDFKGVSKSIEKKLTDLAKRDEKVTIRALAIDNLTEINPTQHYDLFFNCAMLKNNKESAAGLRGMLKIDPDKAYNLAIFRIVSSSGELDLAITEVLIEKGTVKDIAACKKFITARKKFFKTRYVPHYLRLLSTHKNLSLIHHHLEYICTTVQSEKNHSMTAFLVKQLYEFRSSIKRPGHELHHLSSALIPLLSEIINKLLRSPQ